MKSFFLVLVGVFSAAMAFAANSGENTILDCGVLKNSKGVFSKSAPSVTVVNRLEKGKSVSYLKLSSLGKVEYEKLATAASNRNAQVQESKSYRLLTVVAIDGTEVTTIKSKANSQMKSECKKIR